MGDPIAIVGMAARVPGADTLERFRHARRSGQDQLTELSHDALRRAGVPARQIETAHYVRRAPVLDDVAGFDSGYFGLPQSQAELMDPQHRIFMECAVEALEDGCIAADRGDLHIGVFASASISSYLLFNVLPGMAPGASAQTLMAMAGNDKDYLASHTAYLLGLRGPAVGIQTACSSSLVGVHYAMRSLADGECDVALAGGVTIRTPHRVGYEYETGSILSPTGACRSFDAAADGTVFGSGAGVVALTRLSTARSRGLPVYAVLLGSAVNNDGSEKAGFTAPGLGGQTAVISEALAASGLGPDDIGYVEGHGTGTPIGDPMEVRALSEAFIGRSAALPRIALGSAKATFGHLEAASGVVGLISASLAVSDRTLPALAHFRTPNPLFRLDQTPFSLTGQTRDWPQDLPCRAGVSSFGIGGTNAHVILGAAPGEAGEDDAATTGAQLYPVSARCKAALADTIARHAAHLDRTNDFVAAARTARLGRQTYPMRAAVVAHSAAEAARALRHLPPSDLSVGPAKTGFVFSGQGGRSWPDIAALRARFGAFRRVTDRAVACLPDLADVFDGRRVPDPADTATLQPALFALQAAVTETLAAFGVVPACVTGHSVGEIAAAWAAGMIGFDDALTFAQTRGQRMAQQQGGAMANIAAPASTVQLHLAAGVTLAAFNGADAVVVAGPDAAIDDTIRTCIDHGLAASRLAGSVAFHSPLMAGCAADLTAAAAKITAFGADCTFVSTLTGDLLQALPPDHWARHARQPVAFQQAMATMAAQGVTTLVEIGSGAGLSGLLRAGGESPDCVPALGGQGDPDAFLSAIADLFMRGCDVDPGADTVGGRLARLPTYPFQRRRHWIAPPPPPVPTHAGAGASASLWPDRPGWLADHRVDGRPVMPAAGFAAFLLAATGRRALGPTRFDAMLDIGAAGVELSVAGQDGVISVLAAAPGAPPQPYASTQAATSDGPDAEPPMPPSAGAPLDSAEFYDSLRTSGIDLGPSLQRLTAIARSENSARADIRMTQAHSHGFGAPVHPVILDAMFQVLAAATGTTTDIPHVPVSFEALTVYGDMPSTGLCRCHATLRADRTGDLIGDIALYGADDAILVQVTGLTSRATAPAYRSMLYAPVWIKDPNPNLVPPKQVVADLPLPTVDASRIARYLDGIDRLAGLHISRALRDLAAVCLPATQAQRYDRLLERFKMHLRDDGLLDGHGHLSDPSEDMDALAERLERDFPDHGLETAMVRHCGPELARILSGRTDPVAHLFGEGLGKLGTLYGEGVLSRTLNACLADALAIGVGGQTGLRVLELGGGTGGSTRHVLPRLAGQLAEYRFTDLSPGFFPEIEARYKDTPGFVTAQLNVEQEFAGQGLPRAGYHLVLASNVLHAAGDLRAAVGHAADVLEPGGWLAMIEGFMPSRWLDVTFGLTAGWWMQTDRDLRPDYPLLSQPDWHALLRDCGFDEIEIVTPGTGRLAEQGIVLARKAPLSQPEMVDVTDVAAPLATALSRLQQPVPSALVAIRNGAQIRPHDMPDADQASVSGLVKAALLEDNAKSLRVVDVVGNGAADALHREAGIADRERFAAWRGGIRLLERLAPVPAAAALPPRFAATLHDGAIRFAPCPETRLGPDQVEIELRAAGLNFKDVLGVLGAVPVVDGLGSDAAGIVTRVGSAVDDLQPGQRVVALAAGAFASHMTVPRARIVPLNARTSFAQAAALPVAGITAVHVLSELLSLKPGDRVLIHTATGGVGHFAVQLAQAAGAEIFATAGSDWKRCHLRDRGVVHVFDSRSTGFAERIRAIAPDGLDAVINTLSGDAIGAGLDLLRPGGQFIELGRHGIRSAEDVGQSHPDIDYSIVSLDQVDDATGGRLLGVALERMNAGDISPPPLTVMPMARLTEAVDLMKRGGHLGKIVLRNDPPFAFRADRAYLITGAMGGIGLALARAAVEAGAGALHLTAHGALTDAQRQEVAKLAQGATRIDVHLTDLADGGDVDDLLTAITASDLPLAGLFHAAGRLDDALIGDLTPARLDHVTDPKLVAARRFDARLGDLDAFVLFSSAAGGLGSPGQGNHAAAATALDAIAEARHARGLRALAIDWGAWGDIGAAHARGADVRTAGQGIGTITPQAGFRALFDAIATGLPRVFALPLDLHHLAQEDVATRNPIFERLLPQTESAAQIPEVRDDADAGAVDPTLHDLGALPAKQRLHRLAAMVETHARRLMNIATQDMSHDRPLQELGLDSLMSIELRNQLGKMTGRTLPATLLFNTPTIDSLAGYLADLIWPIDAAPPDPAHGQDDEETLYLDDDELDRILNDMESRYGEGTT